MKWKEVGIAVGISFMVTMAVQAITPSFPEAWNSAYESIPLDSEQESLGAGRIRDLKTQIRERMQQEHSWNGDGNDGFNEFVALLQQSADPAPQFDLSLTGGELYTKLVGSNDELFYKDSSGNVIQITNSGALSVATQTPSGTIAYFGATTAPSGWLLGNGQAVSRSTYASLFTAIGTTFGSGDGATTFNVPNCSGAFIAGYDAGNVTGRLTGVNSATNAGLFGNFSGSQNLSLALVNMPGLPVTINDPGFTVQTPGLVTGSGGLGTSGSSSSYMGSAENQTATSNLAHSNVTASISGPADVPLPTTPPAIVLTCMVKQ